MKNIWKGLMGLFAILLGFALWIAGSIIEGIMGGWVGESFLLTRGAMGIGFLLIFVGPIFFWIILPLKDRWYESHPKRFIVAITPFFLFLLLIFGAVIPGIIHEPQLPEYSFNTTLEHDKLVVDISRITEGDLSGGLYELYLKLSGPDGEQIDSEFVDLKDGRKRIELNLAYFGVPTVGNYTLVIENIKDEIVYKKKIEVSPSKYDFSISTVDDEVHLTIIKTEAGSIPDTLEVALDEKEDTFSGWRDFSSQEIEIKDEKTLILKPKYGIGDFSKEYLVKVKNINNDVVFNESVILKPKSIKFGDGIVVNDIKIISISATYRDNNPKFDAPYFIDNPVKAKEGYNFLVIKLIGKNIGVVEPGVRTFVDDAILKTTKGYLYHAYNYPSNVAEFPSLLPKEKATDYLVFEIPGDQRGVEVYFKIGDEEKILRW